MDYAAVMGELDRGQGEALLALRDAWWRMLEDFMRRVSSGKVNARNIESQSRSAFRGMKAATEMVERVLRRIAGKGGQHVRQEVGRQVGIAAEGAEYAAVGREVEVLAGLSLSDLWKRLLGSGLGEWARLSREGLVADELELRLRMHLEGLSEKPLEYLARTTSTVAYSEGRSESIEGFAARGIVQQVARSEQLDPNVCDPCRALHLTVVDVGSAEYERLKPPSQCDGRDQCRGVYIPLVGGPIVAPRVV